MSPSSYAQLRQRVGERLAAVDHTRFETPLGTVEYAPRGISHVRSLADRI
jgi:hypothetical protein